MMCNSSQMKVSGGVDNVGVRGEIGGCMKGRCGWGMGGVHRWERT